MSFSVEYLHEPKLQFGKYFEHQDTKTGLAENGPFGTNVGGRSPVPEREQAEVLAARLAKYGVNMLRIHAIDSRWAPLIDYERGDSRQRRRSAFEDDVNYFHAIFQLRCFPEKKKGA